jgi:hypothetical protein
MIRRRICAPSVACVPAVLIGAEIQLYTLIDPVLMRDSDPHAVAQELLARMVA